MANFSGSIDLMKLQGARYLAGIDSYNMDRQYICIPVTWNDIKVQADSNAQSGYRATLKLSYFQTSEAYAKACKEAKQRNGDDITNYTPPSHTCELRYSKEYLEKLREKAKANILAAHPEWNTPELQDETRNKELRNAIYDMTRLRLGSSYVMHSRNTNDDMPPMAQRAAAATTPATPPAEGDGNNPEDDLPF